MALVDAIKSLPERRGQPSRTFGNTRHTYVNGKQRGDKIHPSARTSKGMIRVKRVDVVEDYVYTEGETDVIASG